VSSINKQEKFIILFLLITAIVGAVIGIFRDNWFKHPDILVSPQNLPDLKIAAKEKVIISDHNDRINQRSESDFKESDISIDQAKDSSREKVELSPKKQSELASNNKTESIKKNVTKNTSGLININSASKEDFMSLPYIGEVKAERIIQLRNEMGVFTSIEDLEKVKGIGPKTLTKIEPLITI